MDELFKNFAMMIPKHAIYSLNGYSVMGATRQEFENFKEWFESEKFQQLQLGEYKIDMWIRRTDLIHDHIGYSIQELFRRWKANPPQTGYGFTSFEMKL